MAPVNRHARIVRGALAVYLLCAMPRHAHAQGCSACYTQAAGSGFRMIRALRSGIVVLIVPPVLCCFAISWVAFKKRNQFDDDSCDEPTNTDSAD
jgi:hypothetical protein